MLPMHISLISCVNHDSVALDMFSQGEGDGAAVVFWRGEESHLLTCSLFCT